MFHPVVDNRFALTPLAALLALSFWTCSGARSVDSSPLRFCSSLVLSLIIFSRRRMWHYRNNLRNYFDHNALFERVIS